MTGHKLCSITAQRWPTTKVLTITGYNEQSAFADADLEAHRHGHLQKPFTQAELGEQLTRMLEGVG